jgi:hypothetical protein
MENYERFLKKGTFFFNFQRKQDVGRKEPLYPIDEYAN